MSNNDLSAKPEAKRSIPYGKALYSVFLMFIMAAVFTVPAFAAPTVWDKAQEIMKDDLMWALDQDDLFEGIEAVLNSLDATINDLEETTL